MIILRNGETLSSLQQKEFGIVSNKLGELRKKVIHKLTGSAVNNYNLRIAAPDESTNLPKVAVDKNLRSKLYKNAGKKGVRISRLNIERKKSPQSPVVMSNKKALDFANADDIVTGYKNKPKTVKKLRKSATEGKEKIQIILPNRGNAGRVEQVAHEIGHALNEQSLNPVTRYINKRAKRVGKESNKRFEMIKGEKGNHGRSGILTTLRGIIDEECLIAEEKNATKKGLKELKKIGLDKKQLDLSRSNLNTGLNTYIGRGRANWKTTLRNTIQTKDKKKGDIFYD